MASPACGMSLLAILFAAAPDSVIRFVDRAAEAGLTRTSTNGDPERKYIIDSLGSGAALLDYDLDGDLDLYLANGSTLAGYPPGKEPVGSLYRNDGKGRFTDVTAGSGLAVPFWGFGTAVGDYDNDGDPDLFVTAWGQDRLFRNEGDGHFRDTAELAGITDSRFGAGAAFLDFDNDGDLDLFVANYVTFVPAKVPAKGDPGSPCSFRGLTVFCGPHGIPGAFDVLYRNNGDGTFSDVTESAGLMTEGTYYGLGVTTADITGDGRQEILVANDSTPNLLYRNLGDGRFADEGVMAGFAYSNDGREQAGMGIHAADIDQDLDLDVVITNFSHDYDTLRLNDGKGYLEDVTVRVGLAEPTLRTLGWGTLIVDLENDGDLDIVIANGHVYPEVDRADIGTTYAQRNQVFENMGNLVLREVTAEQPASPALAATGLHRGMAGGDLDDDGDLDLVITVLDALPRLLINESSAGPGGSSWIAIRLVGVASNRDAVGAQVKVTAGERTWMAERTGGGSYLSSSDPRVRFGLGKASRADSVEIRWPSGVVQRIGPVPVGKSITVLETDSGKPGR